MELAYTIQESEKTYARRTTFQAGGSSRSTTRPAPRDFADGCSFQVHVISTASKGPCERKRASRRKWTQPVECFKCGQRGHFAINCPNQKIPTSGPVLRERDRWGQHQRDHRWRQQHERGITTLGGQVGAQDRYRWLREASKAIQCKLD